MALPEKVQVRLMSEAAGSISITPVVVQEMPLRDLVELMLPTAGKDAARIRELLLRGTLVNGASRFRWQGIDATAADVEALLDEFPESDPARAFTASRCIAVVLQHSSGRIDILREAGERRPFLKRRSFWDALMALAELTTPQYAEYSYRDRADRFRIPIDTRAALQLRERAQDIPYSTLRARIQAVHITAIEFLAAR